MKKRSSKFADKMYEKLLGRRFNYYNTKIDTNILDDNDMYLTLLRGIARVRDTVLTDLRSEKKKKNN